MIHAVTRLNTESTMLNRSSQIQTVTCRMILLREMPRTGESRLKAITGSQAGGWGWGGMAEAASESKTAWGH